MALVYAYISAMTNSKLLQIQNHYLKDEEVGTVPNIDLFPFI